MEFKQWLTISESVEASLDSWLNSWLQWLEKNEPTTQTEVKKIADRITSNPNLKDNIVKALTNKNKQNQNYLRYLVGFLAKKPAARLEDMEQAIDALAWMLSRHLTNADIHAKGWYKTGMEADEYIRQKKASEEIRLSDTQALKQRKTGQSPTEIKPIAQQDDIKLFLVKGVDPEDKQALKIKHGILCSLGKNTDWCTADPTGTYHEQYAKNDIFIIHKDNKPLFQYAKIQDDVDKKTLQFMNTADVVVIDVPPDVLSFIQKHTPEEAEYYHLIPAFNVKTDIEQINKLSKEEKEEIYNKILKAANQSFDEIQDEDQANNILFNVINFINNVEDFKQFAESQFGETLKGSNRKIINFEILAEFLERLNKNYLYEWAFEAYPDEFIQQYADDFVYNLKNYQPFRTVTANPIAHKIISHMPVNMLPPIIHLIVNSGLPKLLLSRLFEIYVTSYNEKDKNKARQIIQMIQKELESGYSENINQECKEAIEAVVDEFELDS